MTRGARALLWRVACGRSITAGMSDGGILIVGGSAEARALAWLLPQARVLLPGAERVAATWPGIVDHGPVSAEWLRHAGLRAVIEAAHPCDAQTAWEVAAAARALGVPHLQLVRAPWRPGRGDRWVLLRCAQDNGRVIPPGARVFATTGRDGLSALRGIRGVVLARVIGGAEAPFPLPRGWFIAGEGPFSVAQEMRLLRRLRIDWLVLRNAGGSGGWPKIEAARRLGLRVAMIARPPRPEGPQVRDVKEAVRWLREISPSG